jgi:hypothetical protein
MQSHLVKQCVSMLQDNGVMSAAQVPVDDEVVSFNERRGVAFLVLSVGPRHIGAYCMGRLPQLNANGPIFWRGGNNFSPPAGTIGVAPWAPAWQGPVECGVATWVVVAHVKSGVAFVKAVTNDANLVIRPVSNLVGFYLHQRIGKAARVGPGTFGVLIAFNRRGDVLGTMTLRTSNGSTTQSQCKGNT